MRPALVVASILSLALIVQSSSLDVLEHYVYPPTRFRRNALCCSLRGGNSLSEKSDNTAPKSKKARLSNVGLQNVSEVEGDSCCSLRGGNSLSETSDNTVPKSKKARVSNVGLQNASEVEGKGSAMRKFNILVQFTGDLGSTPSSSWTDSYIVHGRCNQFDDLAFVGRKKEAFLLGDKLLSNQRRILSGSVSSKAILVSAGQMYGSGKSMMGKFATWCIRMSSQLQRSLCSFNAQIHSELFEKRGLLDAYLDSTYIHVDMTAEGALLEDLGAHIAFLLFLAFSVAFGLRLNRTTFRDLPQHSVRNVVEHFQNQYPGKTFFLHFDELGIFESSNFNVFFDDPDRSLPSRMSRYYKIWNVLIPLLNMEGVYVFATDKHPAFSLIGNGLVRSLVSPCRHFHLVLSGLSAREIVQTFVRTVLPNGTLLHSLIDVPKKILFKFAEQIHLVTGGVPRMVHATFETLCMFDPPIRVRSEEDISTALKLCYSRVISAYSSLFDSAATINQDLKDVYVRLMLLSMLKQPINVISKILFPGTLRQLKLLDIIERLGIFIEPAQAPSGSLLNDQIYLRFPAWTLKYMSETQMSRSKRFPLIAPLVNMPEVLDTRAPLECLLKMVLLWTAFSRFGRKVLTIAQHFPIFAETSVAKLTFDIKRSQPVSCIPGVKMKKKGSMTRAAFEKARTMPNTIWRRRMHPKDWPVCFEILVNEHSVIHPAPKSSSPDLLYVAKKTDPTILGFALKLNEVGTSWSTIRDEINKAAPILAVKRLCLVIIALTFSSEIIEVMEASNLPRIVLKDGSWKFCGSTKYLVATDSADQKADLIIPPEMELIIIGREALKDMVGEYNIDTLNRLVKERSETGQVDMSEVILKFLS